MFFTICRVSFQFKSSKRSNNGTDVGTGQIPELLFRPPELESDEGEELQVLGREFSSTVSPVSSGWVCGVWVWCGWVGVFVCILWFFCVVQHVIALRSCKYKF